MNDIRRIGMRQVPDDADIAEFLKKMFEEHNNKLAQKENELKDTIDETVNSNEPSIFAFGKLLNYLATLEKPDLIELLSAAMWDRCW